MIKTRTPILEIHIIKSSSTGKVIKDSLHPMAPTWQETTEPYKLKLQVLLTLLLFVTMANAWTHRTHARTCLLGQAASVIGLYRSDRGLAQANTGRQSPAQHVLQPRMQAAQPPQQAPVQSLQEGAAGPAPVTVVELNTLREGFKNNPNDHALGLRFAKRLVEAASVLSSEHGRADAKQTAKNRERYIFDATKVVKKLVSSNYTNAMFYLADCYGQGLLGLPVDPKEAFLLYQSASEAEPPTICLPSGGVL